MQRLGRQQAHRNIESGKATFGAEPLPDPAVLVLDPAVLVLDPVWRWFCVQSRHSLTKSSKTFILARISA